jgi:hypothetical protein
MRRARLVSIRVPLFRPASLLLAAGLAVLAGCGPQASFEEKQASAEALAENGANFRNCLFAHAVLQTRYLGIPLNEAKTRAQCAALETAYRDSVHQAAFGGPGGAGNAMFRANTARESVEATVRAAFQAAEELRKVP